MKLEVPLFSRCLEGILQAYLSIPAVNEVCSGLLPLCTKLLFRAIRALRKAFNVIVPEIS